MPLLALLDDARVSALDLDDDGWDALRQSSRRDRQTLRTTCCGWPALARTSKRGLRHFAHRPGADCQTDGESPQHLEIKSLLIGALRAEGFAAEPEVAGEGYRTDVLASRGPEQVAFEVQWSPQTPERTLERSATLARAGVRPIWLQRHPLHWSISDHGDLLCLQIRQRGPGDYRIKVGGVELTVAEFVRVWARGQLRPSRYRAADPLDFEFRRFTLPCPHCDAETPAAAFAPAPDRSACGEGYREDRDSFNAAVSALHEQLLGRRISLQGLDVFLGRHGQEMPWIQRCQTCAQPLADGHLRRTLKALDIETESELVFAHEGKAPAWMPGGWHWCLEGYCDRLDPAFEEMGLDALCASLVDLAGREGLSVRELERQTKVGAQARLFRLGDNEMVLCLDQQARELETAMWRARFGPETHILTAGSGWAERLPDAYIVISGVFGEPELFDNQQERISLSSWLRRLNHR